MKLSPLAIAVAVVLLPALSSAQPRSIRIKQGESLEYNVRAELEISELTDNREETLRASTNGVAQLKARRVSRGKIEWSYETPDVRVVKVTSSTQPEVTTETTVQTKSGRLSTDAKGKVVSGARDKGGSEPLTSLMEAMHRNLVTLWFQPAIFRKMKPGDTWTEQRDDRLTVSNMGIDLRARYRISYRFDGIVDTLGTKAVRVTWNASQMEIDGSRTTDGVSAPVEGDGEHYGTSYFSTIDGLLLASLSENTVDILVTPADGDGRVIPMSWRMRSESIRR